MLNKKNRINLNQFDFLNKKPIKTIDNLYFKLIIYKNNGLNNRYGVFVSKKTIKKSSARNKIKRIFFEEFSKIKQNAGFDFIIKPKKDIINISKKELKKEINVVLNQKNEYL